MDLVPVPRVADGPGLRLARAFFDEVVAPLVATAVPDLRYAAGLIGPGSEVLGFDTARSSDHDFGPRVLVFLAADEPRRADVVAGVEAGLPETFGGYPTRFSWHGAVSGPVSVTDVGSWSRTAFGDVAGGTTDVRDWLGRPWQVLAEATAGAVFRDDRGELAALRRHLRWYPDDVWRYVLACQWLRVSQEEAFVGRTGEIGDDLGSRLLTARLVRDLMRLALLIRRQWPPYGKWLGTAFARLPDGGALLPSLTAAVRADDWPGRESALCDAYAYLGATQNTLALCAPVDAGCRAYYDRPFQVIDAERFTVALLDAVTDPAVRALPRVGCVDQFIDCTDVLLDAGRSRAAARAIFGPPGP